MKSKSVYTKIALVLFCSSIFAPGMAQASPEQAFSIAQCQTSSPEIDSFSIRPVRELAPGAELIFTLLGTPNSNATMTISGVATNLKMQQIEPGVYQSRYTVRSQDKIDKDTVVRANLMQDNRISSTRLDQPLITNSGTINTSNSASSDLSIKRFAVNPSTSIAAGTELTFTLVGTPKAKAAYTLVGTANNVSMQEVAPGIYRGRYVVRTQDVPPAAGTDVYATLQANGKVVRTQLASKLTTASSQTAPFFLDILSPDNQSQVDQSIEVKGKTLPDTTVKVNIQSKNSVAGIFGINRTIFDQEVKANNQGEFLVNVRPGLVPVSGTRYEIQLKATSGNNTQEKTLTLIQK